MSAFFRPLAGAFEHRLLSAAIAILSNGSALAQTKQAPMRHPSRRTSHAADGG